MTASVEPLVSVVIPCYNQGRFLRDAIESALGQTDGPVEIIVVDDGSADGAAAVARRFPQVHVIQQQNRGAASARNAGLAASRGQLLIFLDADDRLLPSAVVRGREALAAHPEWGFVTGHVRLIDADGSPAAVPAQEHQAGDPYVGLLRSNYIWTPGAVVYRRAVFEIERAFDASAGGSADYELNIRLARRFSFGCHHHVVVECRKHPENMSANLEYMLRSAVSVRRAQRRHVAGRPAVRRAWKEGIRIVQADFGERLLEQVKGDLRTAGRRRMAMTGLLCLLLYYPAGVGKILSARARALRTAAR